MKPTKNRYQPIAVRVWRDEKFRPLSLESKAVWLMLLSHPEQTSLGVLPIFAEGLAAELGVSPKKFWGLLSPIIQNDMARYSKPHGLFVIPNFIKYQPPHSPKLILNWASMVPGLPYCSLLHDYLIEIQPLINALGATHQEYYQTKIIQPLKSKTDTPPDTLSDRVSTTQPNTLCHSTKHITHNINTPSLRDPQDTPKPTGQYPKPHNTPDYPLVTKVSLVTPPLRSSAASPVPIPFQPSSLPDSPLPPRAPVVNPSSVLLAPIAAALNALTAPIDLDQHLHALTTRCLEIDQRGPHWGPWYFNILTALEAKHALLEVEELLDHGHNSTNPQSQATKGIGHLHTPGPWLVKQLTHLAKQFGITHWPDFPEDPTPSSSVPVSAGTCSSVPPTAFPAFQPSRLASP